MKHDFQGRTRRPLFSLLTMIGLMLSTFANAETCERGMGHGNAPWVGAWTASPAYAQGEFNDQTVRMVISPRSDGQVFRVGFSNRFGERPVTFSSVWVGKQQYAATLVAGSNCRLTFHGAQSLTLPAGMEAFSDPVKMPMRAFENLLVSMHVAGESGPATRHELAQQYSYVAPAEAGDQSAEEVGDRFTRRVESYFFVHAIEAADPSGRAAAIVTQAAAHATRPGYPTRLAESDRK